MKTVLVLAVLLMPAIGRADGGAFAQAQAAASAGAFQWDGGARRTSLGFVDATGGTGATAASGLGSADKAAPASAPASVPSPGSSATADVQSEGALTSSLKFLFNKKDDDGLLTSIGRSLLAPLMLVICPLAMAYAAVKSYPAYAAPLSAAVGLAVGAICAPYVAVTDFLCGGMPKDMQAKG